MSKVKVTYILPDGKTFEDEIDNVTGNPLHIINKVNRTYSHNIYSVEANAVAIPNEKGGISIHCRNALILGFDARPVENLGPKYLTLMSMGILPAAVAERYATAPEKPNNREMEGFVTAMREYTKGI